MMSGGKDGFDVCKGLSNSDAAYRRQLSQQHDDHQRKTQDKGQAGDKADQFKMVTAKLSPSVYGADRRGTPRISPLHMVASAGGRQVAKAGHGMTVITCENALDKVTGKAIVIVANPADAKVVRRVGALRSQYPDHKFLLLNNSDKLGAYAALTMLDVANEMAERVANESRFAALVFEDGSFKGQLISGMTVITCENALDEVTGKAMVIVANPADPQLDELVSGLRKDYPGHKFLFMDNTDLGAYGTLVMLDVDTDLAGKIFSEGLIEPLLFDNGSCQGVAQPSLVPPKPLSEADKDDRPVRPIVPDKAKKAKEVAKAEKKEGQAEASKTHGSGARLKALKKAEKTRKAEEQKKAEERRKKAVEEKKVVIIKMPSKEKKLIKGPTGFIQLSWKNIGEVEDVINRGEYPVMVVVGSGHGASDKCKELLVKLQHSGQWEYHRLVFINKFDESAPKLMKKLNIYDHVERIKKRPQVYVFRGELEPEVPPGGFTLSAMRKFRKRLVRLARKVGEAGKEIKGPLGFLRLTSENRGKIKGEIQNKAYPVMLMVGNAREYSVKLKKVLEKLQKSGKWDYHRLVFVNAYTEHGEDLLKEFGILEIAKEVVEELPQIYVFKGRRDESGRLVPEKPKDGFTKSYMKSQRVHYIKEANKLKKTEKAK